MDFSWKNRPDSSDFYQNIGWQGEKQPVQVMQGQPRGPCYTGEQAYLAGPHG